MIVAGSTNPLLMGVSTGYNLTRSLRFRSSASAYLNRTLTTPTNQKIWTYSTWLKRGTLNSADCLFSTSDNYNAIRFVDTNGALIVYGDAGGTMNIETASLYRDPSAWYHIVVAYDSTQATASNRVKIYVNGVQVTSFTTSTYPSLNATYGFNSALVHAIGRRQSTSNCYLDGYLSELNFIDGQALTPSSFGQTSSTTGVWQPKKYTGTYGTNGFYLPFTDNSALTSGSNAGLGKDFSGNGNYWNTNNISITSGVTYDSMTDVPTLTSATAANFAVMNPLDQAGGLLVTDGNLKTTANTGWDGARATFSLPSSGKYYWETTCISRSTGATVGLLSTTAVITGDLGAAATGYVYNSGDGQKYNNGSASAYGATWGTNDVIGIAWDADTGTLTFYKNGTSQGTAWSSLSGTYSPAIGVNGSDSMAANFGQRPFAYTPPTGYVALNTYNLPTPTIGATASSQANKYMDVALYTGTNSTLTITNSGGLKPDFIWIKSRSNATTHNLADTNRGISNFLFSNGTGAEQTATAGTGITSVNSNGFTLGTDTSTSGNTNTNGYTFVGWQWSANGGTNITNTAGSITSTVSANTTSGFSVVTYTGNATSGATVGHGLGVKPAMIIQKTRSIVNSWKVWHQSLPNANTQLAPNNALPQITLNSTSAYDSAPNDNLKAISSTLVTLGANDQSNPSGGTMVMYCFAEIAGFSKFGSYTGNGSTDGPFVYTGFLPRYVMIKRTDTTGNWIVHDTARSDYNVTKADLFPNLSNAEETTNGNQWDMLSNGFKFRDTNAAMNASGGTYIYAAFASYPNKFSLAK